MHIVIDAHMLGEREGGNETYVAGLLAGFEMASIPDPVRVTALHNARFNPPSTADSPVRYLKLENRDNFYRLFWQIPKLCRSLRADVLHMTYNASPILPCPLVISVHDVSFRRYPDFFSPRVRLLLSTLLPLSMRRASLILTLSEASKCDIVHYYPFARHKIAIIPLAAGPVVGAKPAKSAIKAYTAGADFILTVGTVQPRKNISRLVQAYISLRQREATKARLIIVGRDDWQHSEIHRFAQASPYADDIVFAGYLADEVVAALYQACAVFVYPSLYEGFGLPVLEAMTCGAPVITSNVSSLPEIAGEAAILVDPHSVEQIRAALENVLGNLELQENLRQRGKKRAKAFSWQHTAQATIAAYEHMLQPRGKPA